MALTEKDSDWPGLGHMSFPNPVSVIRQMAYSKWSVWILRPPLGREGCMEHPD